MSPRRTGTLCGNVVEYFAMPPSSDPRAPRPRPRRDPFHVPHRKNAAEWVMWLALLPLVPLAHLIERVRGSGERKHG
jgi:hypothetical protein